MFDSLWPHGLYSPWNSPVQNTGVASCSLLQGSFPTQESNRGLLHCKWILYQLSYHKKCKYNVVVQSLSHVWLFASPWIAAHQAPLFQFAQIHVRWVGDAIYPSHPLVLPSPFALGLSQHQGLFHWINSSHQMAKILEPQLQHQSFQWIFKVDFL